MSVVRRCRNCGKGFAAMNRADDIYCHGCANISCQQEELIPDFLTVVNFGELVRKGENEELYSLEKKLYRVYDEWHPVYGLQAVVSPVRIVR